MFRGRDGSRTGFDQLEFAAPVAVAGVIRHGFQARFTCRSDLPEEDVYAQLEVYVPALAGYAHVQRVGWRPNAPHTNNANAPSDLRFKTKSVAQRGQKALERIGVGHLRDHHDERDLFTMGRVRGRPVRFCYLDYYFHARLWAASFTL